MEDYRKIAIELGQTLINKAPETREDVERMLPELKESEDEKVEKAIFGMVYDSDNELWSSYDVSKSDVLAWLEKQGEQKPAGKVELKFKAGDWISGYYTSYKVLSVNNDGYVVEDVDGNKINILFENEKFHHLWTIQDAKDGDVLVASDGSIFIFKDTIDGACKHYVALTTDNVVKFSEGLEHYWETQSAVHPATKEQREQLRKAMTDAGWEFDFEKKELKKIEQKPAELDENRSKELSLSLQIQAYLNTASDELYAKGKPLYSEERLKDIHKCMLMWVKLHNAYFYQKPKVEWSEEDELHIRKLERLVKQVWAIAEHENDKDTIHKMRDLSFFLKTLKPQPKQEWSEEDKHGFENCLYAIKEIFKGVDNPYRVGTINWLKSLRPQNHWKPSAKQLNELHKVITNTGFNPYVIKSLYDDIKKLKE